jgi:enamine deaminase RidA (YjgF/YER057c/UK114 family)
MTIDERLQELELELPPAPAPAANYTTWVRTGNLLFLAGHIPNRADGEPAFRGKIGRELTVDEGQAAARFVTLNLLATLRAALGSLDRVTQIVKVTGFVNAAAGFTEQPRVLNGCSDLLVAIFGTRGQHARSAVGVSDLPLGVPVEIELLVEAE